MHTLLHLFLESNRGLYDPFKKHTPNRFTQHMERLGHEIRNAVYDWLRPEAFIGAEHRVELCQRRAVLGNKLSPILSLSKYPAKYDGSTNGSLEFCQRVRIKCSPIREAEVSGCSGSHGIPSGTETAGLKKMESLMRPVSEVPPRWAAVFPKRLGCKD